MDHDTPFEPLNDLEVRLLQAQDGTLTAAQFLDGLLTSTAFVLLDKAIGEDGAWDESISPLVLTSESGEPMFGSRCSRCSPRPSALACGTSSCRSLPMPCRSRCTRCWPVSVTASAWC